MTIGSPITSPLFEPEVCGSTCTIATVGLTDPSARAVSPITGTIVRWRIREADAVPYTLRVLTPGGGGAFTPTASSPAAVPVGPGLETFSVQIPIAAGEVIGVDLAAGAHIGFIEGSGGTYGYHAPGIVPNGSPSQFELGPGEAAFNADVQPFPAVTALAPSKGSIAGGTTVTISGTDFSGVTAVSFGGAAAKSFAVASETQLTAVAPKTVKPGPVDVTVTTIAGSSPATAAKFTYTACVVPRLTGKKLKADRKKLRKAGCKLGNVRGEKSKAAKVVKQFRKPGTILPAGAKVGVKVEE